MPLAPYFSSPPEYQTLIGPVIVTLLTLLTCSYIGDMFTSARLFRKVSQTALIFQFAATAAFVPEWRLA